MTLMSGAAAESALEAGPAFRLGRRASGKLEAGSEAATGGIIAPALSRDGGGWAAGARPVADGEFPSSSPVNGTAGAVVVRQSTL